MDTGRTFRKTAVKKEVGAMRSLLKYDGRSPMKSKEEAQMTVCITSSARLSPAGEFHFSVFTGQQTPQVLPEQLLGFVRLLPQGSSVVAPGFRVRVQHQSAIVPQVVR